MCGQYNSFSEPASYVAKYGSTEIFKQQFTYDKLGRIVQKIKTVDGIKDTYEYVYDPAGRLTEVQKERFDRKHLHLRQQRQPAEPGRGTATHV